MDVSVVILTFNSARYIERCLNDLITALEEANKKYEIFVIDNGSRDDSPRLVEALKKQRSANIQLIAFDHNTGTTFSRNQGLAQATGENIIILDSDAYVNANALSHLCNYLETNKACGLAAPKLVYPDGRFQLSTDQFPTFVRKLQRFLFLKKMESQSKAQEPVSGPVDYAISAFWMIPRRVVNQVGLLDERIFYSPEDVDYCIRIWKAGFTIDYIPQVSVIHDAQEISRPKGFSINWFTLSHAKGLFYLFWKHKYFFSGKRFCRKALAAVASKE